MISIANASWMSEGLEYYYCPVLCYTKSVCYIARLGDSALGGVEGMQVLLFQGNQKSKEVRVGKLGNDGARRTAFLTLRVLVLVLAEVSKLIVVNWIALQQHIQVARENILE